MVLWDILFTPKTVLTFQTTMLAKMLRNNSAAKKWIVLFIFLVILYVRFLDLKIPKPTYAKVYSSLGQEFEDNGQFDQAKTSYEKAIFHDPSYIFAYYHLASLYKKLGNVPKQQEYFMKVTEMVNALERTNVELLPTPESKIEEYADAYYEVGLNLYKREKLNEAITYFKQCDKYKMGHLDCNYLLGLAYYKLGDIKKVKRQIIIIRQRTRFDVSKPLELLIDYVPTPNEVFAPLQ